MIRSWTSPLPVALVLALLAGGPVPARAAADAPEAVASAPAKPDLSTPRRALRHFVDAGQAENWEAAAAALDLSGVSNRDQQGPRLARQLEAVLERVLWIEWEEISDEPEGNPADGKDAEVLGTATLAGETVPVRLVRSGDSWRFGASTVSRIPALYAEHGPGPIAARMPEVLTRVRVFQVALWQWAGLAVAALLAWLVGLLLAGIGYALVERISKRTAATWDDRLLAAVRGPARVIFSLVFVGPFASFLRLAAPAQRVFDHLLQTLLVISATWLVVRLAVFAADTAEEVFLRGATDEGRRRAIRTKLAFVRRAVVVVISILGSALVLTQFEVVRKVGMSLLASAGIAGIVIGLAAQKTISTLLAGFQLSLTQPVRIGDTVIVEGEWGTIEEIHLTYVVVKVWDLRRLVVPIGRFLDQPFQNWTKQQSTEILGTVEVPADFTAPVDRLREELLRICKASPNWDGKVAKIQVTVLTEHTMTARACVSSADAGKNWDLRCEVREGLVKFLKELEGGRYLPKTRREPPSDDRRPAENVATGLRPRA